METTFRCCGVGFGTTAAEDSRLLPSPGQTLRQRWNQDSARKGSEEDASRDLVLFGGVQGCCCSCLVGVIRAHPGHKQTPYKPGICGCFVEMCFLNFWDLLPHEVLWSDVWFFGPYSHWKAVQEEAADFSELLSGRVLCFDRILGTNRNELECLRSRHYCHNHIKERVPLAQGCGQLLPLLFA